MGAHDWFGGPVTGDDTARTFGKLRDSCAELDRPYESVLRSHVAMPLVMAETEAALAEKRRALPQDVLAWCGDALFAGTPEQTITYYRGLAAAGFQYFVANILDEDLSTIDLMIEHLVPAFRAEEGKR